MKALLYSLVFFTLALPLPAQNLSWTDPANEWHYDFAGVGFNETSFISLSITRDTTLGERKCAIMTPSSPTPEFRFEYGREIITYHNEGILEQYADGEFWPLYNFNLEVGDVYSVYLPTSSYFPGSRADSIRLRVDTVTTKIIAGREVRAQHVTTIAGASFGFEGWNYEFFGNLDYYFVPVNLISCDAACPNGQLCFSAPEAGLDVSFTPDRPCEFTSTYQVDLSNDIKVYPNPVSRGQELTLTLPASLAGQLSQVRLFNGIGQLVQSQTLRPGAMTRNLILPNLPGGLYHLVWESAGARASKKVVIAD